MQRALVTGGAGFPRVGLAEGLQRFAARVSTQPLPEDRLEAANAELSARGMIGVGSVS